MLFYAGEKVAAWAEARISWPAFCCGQLPTLLHRQQSFRFPLVSTWASVNPQSTAVCRGPDMIIESQTPPELLHNKYRAEVLNKRLLKFPRPAPGR
jgi:hypothetical protein